MKATIAALVGLIVIVEQAVAADITWTGATNTAWDINTTANWINGGPVVFVDGDDVTFDDSAGDNDTVDISSGDVLPNTVTFDSATGNTYTITGANGIGGAPPINLTGNVAVVLGNVNTLTGVIDVPVGTTLTIGAGGNGSTVSGDITGGGSLIIGGAYNPFTTPLSFTGPITIAAGTLTLGTGATLGTPDAGATINMGGALDFNFVTVESNEPLTIDGGTIQTNGSTVILTGPINIAAQGANITLNTNQGDNALNISGDITGADSGPINVNVSSGTTMTIAGNITNNGNLVKAGAGVLALGATTTVAAAEVVVNAGTLNVIAKGTHTLSSGQILSGADAAVEGNVSAASGSTIRVGQAGLPQKTFAEYVDATYDVGGNTTFVDGSTLTPEAGVFSGNDAWSFRTFGNNATLLQGAPIGPYPDNESVPVIMTTVTGLIPNETYDVYVNFWDVSDATWPIRTGDSEATLTLYANPNDNFAGATGAVDPDTLSYSTPVLTAEANRTLWGAQIGQLTADASGTIEVFIDDNGNGPNQRTWYDGVTVSGGITSAVGERFTITGDLTLGAGSTLELDLGTPAQSDLLSITGSLTAGGTLSVILDDTVPAPSEGNVFNLLDFASASGAFNALDLPSLTPGLGWNTSQLLTTGELRVVASAGLPGDYNNNGVVDAADYTFWRERLGQNIALPNKDPNDTDNMVTQAEYSFWRSHFGTSLGAGGALSASQTVPEPGTWALTMLTGCLLAAVGRRREQPI
jgi:hypothetical protein